jgi:hypothetical protein
MTCRHVANDPSCSSYKPPPPLPPTPNVKEFEIWDAKEIGAHLVLKVKYPSCKACSFEGSKVLVFLQTSGLDALRWREIDPHFRDPAPPMLATQAPSPSARFPASPEGWADALAYAHAKEGGRAKDCIPVYGGF